MIWEEKTISSKRIYEGKIISVRVDTVELPEEKQSIREIVEHPGAAIVVPVLPNGKILLVKQFRKPVEECLLEVPAGKLDIGEEPINCARRELAEETGYTSSAIQPLFNFYSTPGFSNEKMHLFIAENLIEGESSPDEDEYIEVEHYETDEIINMIYQGKIKDSKTIIAIFAVKEHLMGQK